MALSTWLDQHLEEFVRPRLGKIPNVDPTIQSIETFSGVKLKALFACWQQAKKRSQGRSILLPGRDVYLFEVLARVENYPTEFREDLSSSTVSLPELVKKDYSKHYVVDTGYAGSTPKALKAEHWDLVLYRPLPKVPLELRKDSKAVRKIYQEARQPHQLFPLANPDKAMVCRIAVDMESAPKYWERASYRKNGSKLSLSQALISDKGQFREAAMLTMYIARAYKPLKNKTIRVSSTGRFL